MRKSSAFQLSAFPHLLPYRMHPNYEPVSYKHIALTTRLDLPTISITCRQEVSCLVRSFLKWFSFPIPGLIAYVCPSSNYCNDSFLTIFEAIFCETSELRRPRLFPEHVKGNGFDV
jgi:hypothetical protein